jgi:preprotein translocase subunit YajC
VKSDYDISAVNLMKEFQTNDSLANKRYADKILTVNGLVTDVETADSIINIKMADEQSGSYIIFSFQKNEEELLKDIIAGDTILVKGSCSGAIYSDILSAYSIAFKRCILLNNKK